MNVYFFTGFPGFICQSLVTALYKQASSWEKIYCLVLSSEYEKAVRIKEEKYDHRLVLLQGDITKPNLNLYASSLEEVQTSVTHVCHLAAIYDLAVPRNIAFLVNVEGTRNVCECALTFQNLQSFCYFSTAYVSGRREGTITEDELVHDEGFKNYYEETKYEAERIVRMYWRVLPLLIIRPGIVKGHSLTGETSKFDGPYFLLNLFRHLRWFPFLPYIGQGHHVIHLVPIDYIIAATMALWHTTESHGKTFHLTGSSPPTVKEVYEQLMKVYLHRSPKWAIPVSFAEKALRFSVLRKWLQVEKEAVDYFQHRNVTYDTTNVQKLSHANNLPSTSFSSAVSPMVQYYHTHKNDKNHHITYR